VSVTCSFGIAAGEPGDSQINKLVAAADEALYEAKRGGRNRVVALQTFALTPEG
jgi:diguanylate cyclase (GGDEF)-like protein